MSRVSRGIRITRKGSRSGLTKSLRFYILSRDNFTCQYCGAKAPNFKLEIDHITPISKGGQTVSTNLITACEFCNNGKKSKANINSEVIEKIRNSELWAEKTKQNKTTIILELFNNALNGINIKNNETSKNLILNAIQNYGFENVKCAVNEALKMVKYEGNLNRYDYNSVLAAFKSIPLLAAYQSQKERCQKKYK